MRKLFALAMTAGSAAVLALAMPGVASAQERETGNACPHSDRSPPCGKKDGDDGGQGKGKHTRHITCRDKLDNDGDRHKDRGDSECRDENDGVEDGNEDPGNGNGDGNGEPCDGTNLVIKLGDTHILCVYPNEGGAAADGCEAFQGKVLSSPLGSACLLPKDDD